MSPSSSGGVRIGRRMIGFGDFPEAVDLDLARQRVERQRSELSERRFRDASPRNASNEKHDFGSERSKQSERPRFVRIDPNANMKAPSQARAVSDCETWEKEKERPDEGRRRGLSSPERAVGLDFLKAGEA
jgi:hypothetical protein